MKYQKITTYMQMVPLLFTLVNCGGGGRQQVGSSVQVSPPVFTDSVTEQCPVGAIQGSLIKISPVDNVPIDGEVTFRVSATGCSNLVVKPVGGTSYSLVGGSVSYTKKYASASKGIQESAVIYAYDNSGKQIGSVSVISAPFDVISSTTNLSCTLTASPFEKTIRVTPDLIALDPAPVFSFHMTAAPSNIPVHIVSVKNANRPETPYNSLQGLSFMGSADFQAAVPALGFNPMIVSIRDNSNPNQVVSCQANVIVKSNIVVPLPTVIPTPLPTVLPVAPTCTLVASPNVITQGQSLVLNLSVNGTLTGKTLVVSGNAVSGTVITPMTSGVAVATVTNAGGSNSCSTSFTVNPNVIVPNATAKMGCGYQSRQCSVPGQITSVKVLYDKGANCRTVFADFGYTIGTSTFWTSQTCAAYFEVKYRAW